MQSKEHEQHFHILSTRLAIGIGLTLLLLTAITVWVAHIDLGRFNFLIAMLIASIKATLVALFFMNLKYDRIENGVIFGTSFLFLAIFLVLTATDLLFRGDVYVKGPIMFAMAQTKSKLKDPWVSTPELIAHGKELFAANCASCHGPTGHGDGPAAAALNPHPRNFTSDQNWKNGRKPTDVFNTLKTGVSGSAMASFAILPPDDRWALAHFVLSLGPTPPAETNEDIRKVQAEMQGGETQAASIPIELAIDRMSEPSPPVKEVESGFVSMHPSEGARLYQANCVGCHGASGEGAVVRNLGLNPKAFVRTKPFVAQSESLQSFDSFERRVTEGLPGDLMPGYGEFSNTEIRELQDYIRQLARSQ